MKQIPITIPATIEKFPQHDELKQSILTAIENQKEIDHLQSADHDITRCDWRTERHNGNREWLKILRPALLPYLEQWSKKCHFDGFTITEIWFQQYDNAGSHHSWHIHGSNFTFVYYLDFPENSPETEMIDPYTQVQSAFDVKEGDILAFPSMVIHRAPPNHGTARKTIISWNLDITLRNNY
jgi:predicted 2-oxoglutarate/Fe(II)-dependent dioxygenase YbiX